VHHSVGRSQRITTPRLAIKHLSAALQEHTLLNDVVCAAFAL